jgi:hypothetical protein
MKWNTAVEFIIVNVIEDGSKQADKIIDLKRSIEVPNLHIEVITVTAFSDLVNKKLGLNVSMTMSWFYKLCDYKPTLAFLFPELVPESKYKVSTAYLLPQFFFERIDVNIYCTTLTSSL